MKILRNAGFLILSLMALSSCAMLDRPYYLRHWERARLGAEKERAQHHWQSAEKLAKEAVLQAKHFGQSDFRLAVSLDDLAQIYISRGKLKLALPLLKESLEVLRAGATQNNSKLVGDLIRQERASVLRALGDIAFEAEDFEKAESYYAESREMLASWCGQCISDRGNPLALDYVRTCFGLAEAQERLNKLDESEKNYRLALVMADNNNFPIQDEIKRRLKEHFEKHGQSEESNKLDAGQRWKELALSARKAYSAGSYEQAAELYRRALVETENFAADDFRRAVNYKGLADCAHRLGNNSEQELYVEKALKVLKVMPNPINSLKDDLLSDLAYNYQLSSREPLLKQVLLEQLALREKTYATKIAQTCSELAALELRQGNKAASKTYAERALKLFLAEPTSKRAVAASLSRLAMTFSELEDYEMAGKSMEESIKITAKHLHLKDARPVLAYFQLSELYALQGQSLKSLACKQDALKYLNGLQPRRYVDTAAGLEGFLNEALVSRKPDLAVSIGRDLLSVSESFASKTPGEPELEKQMSEITGRVKLRLNGLKN